MNFDHVLARGRRGWVPIIVPGHVADALRAEFRRSPASAVHRVLELLAGGTPESVTVHGRGSTRWFFPPTGRRWHTATTGGGPW